MNSDTASYRECVVRTLMSELSEKGHNLYIDRFFNSLSLAEYLECIKKKSMQDCYEKQEKYIEEYFKRVLNGRVRCHVA